MGVRSGSEDHAWSSIRSATTTERSSSISSRASPASVGFLFETDTKQARFLIFFDDVLPIMETICSAQDHLSEDTWPSFVEELLRRSTRIVWIAQDEDDEDFDITTVEEGRAALRETFWEYLDDDET